MNKLKLDKIDKKLLSYAFHGFRTPITRIARNCRISREQAEYRIKKYEQTGLIAGHFTLFNLYALGYTKSYILKLRVKKPRHGILENLPVPKDVLLFTRLQCYGKWDYMLTVFAKSRKDIISLVSGLYDFWKGDFLDYDIFEPIESCLFPLKVFGKRGNDKTLSFLERKETRPDKLDRELMAVISDKAEMKIADLARQLNEKVETVNYRLKRLEKSTIMGYRLFLNLDTIGYNMASIALKLNDLSELSRNRITHYAEQRNRVHACSIGIGRFNTIFQIIYQTPGELSKEINKIKETFSENIIEYEMTLIEKEHSPQTLPSTI